MQNLSGFSKCSAIFESPHLCKTVCLGLTCEITSLELSSSSSNHSTKIEQVSSVMTPSSGITLDSAMLSSGVFSNEPVSSPSTLFSEPSLPDPFAQKDKSCPSSGVTNPSNSPSSKIDMDVQEKCNRKRGQKLQD